MISEVEEEKLRLRLFEAGAAAAFPVEEIPTSHGVDLVSGLFAVPHSEDYDRLTTPSVASVVSGGHVDPCHPR